jgi:hypothetical protein
MLLAMIVMAMTLAYGSSAAPATTQANCLTSTKRDPLGISTNPALRANAIVRGLGLTADQTREVRARLARYRPSRPFTLDGLGLTSEQTREIRRRLAAQVAEWNKYPLGWPCAEFKNRSKVIAFVKAKLIENGFRPNARVFVATPRQIQLRGIQDGVDILGAVVKTGPRQITVRLMATGWAGTYTFRLGFDA